MAVNIGPKIGIDGEAEYRKELQQIIQSTKTLAAETNEAAAAFKNADDKEKAAAEVTEKLNKQIEAQKKLIDKLEDAVQKSADATGENSTQTLKWKEQLAKAKQGLATLETQAQETTGGVENLGTAEEKTGEKTSVFGDVLKGTLASQLIQKGLEATANIIKDIAGYFIEAIGSAAEYADEINTLSTETGISTDTLQEYEYIAKLIDVDVNTITGSMTKLVKKMGDADDGSASALKTFANLGIEIYDVNGNLRDSEDVFNDAIKALKKIKNPTERDAAAMDLFGKSAQDLNPLLETTAADLDAMKKEAHQVGAVMDRDTLDTLNEVQDSLDRVGLTWDAVKKKLGAKLGSKALPELQTFVETLQKFAETGNVSQLIDNLLNQITSERNWSDVGEKIGETLGTLLGKAPKILVAGVKLAGQLLKGFIQGIPKMADAIGKELYNMQLSEAAQNAIHDLNNVRDALAEIPTAAERMESSIGEVNAKQKEAEHWIQIFDELYQKTNPTAEDTERLQKAVDTLNELYPELGLAIDEETGKWNLNTQEIEANIKALSARYRAEAYYAAASEALRDIAKLESEREKHREIAKELERQVKAKQIIVDAAQDEWVELNNLLQAYNSARIDEEQFARGIEALGLKDYAAAEKRWQDLADVLNKNRAELYDLTVQYDSAKSAVDEYDKSIEGLSGDVDWFFSQGAEWGRKAEEMAKAIPAGVAKGISEGTSAVQKAAGLLMASAIDKMKNVAKIDSPSKVTEDVIGKNLAYGVIKGWDDVMNPIKLQSAFTLQPAFDAMTAGGTTNNTNNTTNLGGVSITVNAAEGQDANAIANMVMKKIQSAVDARKAVFS